jgi:hypothetical protein
LRVPLRKTTEPFLLRRCALAAALLACAMSANAKTHSDINGHGEPVPDDPLLACVQRMECNESLGPVSSAKTHFNRIRDTLAFPNDTIYENGRDESAKVPRDADGDPLAYLHRCFVLTRCVIQFHKFVRFEPRAPKLSEDDYRALIRHISRIPTWWPTFSNERKIVIPGYNGLRDFSAARQYLFQREIGWWFITYLRIGNWRMIYPSLVPFRGIAARQITERIDHGELQAVYLSIFPRMNHTVVIYDYSRQQDGSIVFNCYDPNYHNTSNWLCYDATARKFIYQKRWFFPGGPVKLMRIYISPIH